jgi:uncharacterized membrane protein
MTDSTAAADQNQSRSTPTYFFFRGLAIILPPILTLVILLWAANAFNTYVIQPINTVVRYAIAVWTNDIRTRTQLVEPPARVPAIPDWGRNYRVTKRLHDELERTPSIDPHVLSSDPWNREVYVPFGNSGTPVHYVPLAHYDLVFEQIRPQPPPTTAIGLYMEVAGSVYFKTQWQLSAVALSVTIITLYFTGRFVTAKLGRWFVHKFELVMNRLPLIRNVYSSVKQVTDFVLSEREVEFQRVVAVEYPRAGAWTVGFVTGEGIVECTAEVGEPMITVLVPTSPMPAGGFTIMVPRSTAIDLNMTVDQAVQFIVSCGVLTPPHQRVTSQQLALDAQKKVSVQ